MLGFSAQPRHQVGEIKGKWPLLQAQEGCRRGQDFLSTDKGVLGLSSGLAGGSLGGGQVTLTADLEEPWGT